MHSGNLNNTRFDDLRKPMKKTSFVVKKNLGGVGGGGELSQENNPLYQIEIYSSRGDSTILPLILKKIGNMLMFANYIGACPCFDTQLP